MSQGLLEKRRSRLQSSHLWLTNTSMARWGITQFQYLQSPRLENRASVARDHLANERTYLAYLRTSLAFSSVGLAISQLLRLPGPERTQFMYNASTALGVLFVCLGIIFMIQGVFRYFKVQAVLQQGLFPVSRSMIIFSFLISFASIVVAIGIMIELGRELRSYD